MVLYLEPQARAFGLNNGQSADSSEDRNHWNEHY